MHQEDSYCVLTITFLAAFTLQVNRILKRFSQQEYHVYNADYKSEAVDEVRDGRDSGQLGTSPNFRDCETTFFDRVECKGDQEYGTDYEGGDDVDIVLRLYAVIWNLF